MQCQKCGYLLFNLTRWECPECAEPFAVDDYRFAPASVTFHCPLCQQQYYGNDEDGLPSPREFTCVKCSQPVSLNRMMVTPQVEEAMGELKGMSPWDLRKEMGMISAWWATLTMLLLRPSVFYKSHSGQSVKEAYIFALICTYLGMLPMMLFQFVILIGMTAITTGTAGGGGPGTPGAPPIPGPLLTGPPMLFMGGMYLCIGLVFPLFMPFVGAAIAACFIQLGLLVLAPKRKPFVATFCLAMYSYAPVALCVIPLCGQYVAGVWQAITLIMGVKTVHNIEGWRATIAVIWPTLMILTLVVVAVIILIFSGA